LLASPLQSQTARDVTEYRVGAGDVLSVDVAGRPDLSCAPAVRADGRIRLADGHALAVGELTPDEIAHRIARLLRETRGQTTEVRVQVSEYRSRFASVEGAVNRPGRVALRGGTRLVDALVDAGGFSATASGEVVVLRGSEGLRRIAVAVASELGGRGAVDLALPLEHGDRLAALQLEQIAVGGAVHRPGVYPLRDAPTLLAALALAGGSDRFGRRAELQRRSGGDLALDLEALRRGEARDPGLAAGDVISIR
jgi:polysaccharide export outer membrane protein